MTDHLSSQFDTEMKTVTTQVREMGDQALDLLERAMVALFRFDARAAREVRTLESRVHAMEVAIDHEIATVIALRQPAASDLRLLFAASKMTSILERIGGLGAQVAATANHLQDAARLGGVIGTPLALVHSEATRVTGQLHKAIQAFERRQVAMAQAVLGEEPVIEGEVAGLLRQLVIYMVENPQSLSAGIDLVSVAKAIENINVEVKHLAEEVIYAISGEDVRDTAAGA